MARSILEERPQDWELIWENDDPTVAFASQTLSLNLAKYGWVKVEVHWSINTIRSQIFDIPVEEEPNAAVFQLTSTQLPTDSAGNMYSFSRLCQVLPDNVFFQDCSRRRLNTTDTAANSTQNGYLIPSRIWGKTTASSAGGDASFRDSGAGMRLLWTNPDPTAEFASQTISLDLSEYDAVYIPFQWTTTNDNIMTSPILIKEKNTSVAIISNTGNNLQRNVRGVNVQSTGVVFGDTTYRTQGSASTATTANNRMIPLFIYGIKFG